MLELKLVGVDLYPLIGLYIAIPFRASELTTWRQRQNVIRQAELLCDLGHR